jgi:hypothetical protein
MWMNETISSSSETGDMICQNLNELAQNHPLHAYQPFFLICRLCFWCASCIYGSSKIPNKCPVCNDSNIIESIPISNQEAYSFNYDLLRGVTLEFFPKAKTSESD